MAIELIDKIKQKNNGTFKLVDAIDVEMQDGRDVEVTIAEINTNVINVDQKFTEHIENHPKGGSDIHIGVEAPTDETIEVWVDTDDNESYTSNISDSVINEFREIIKVLQEEISYLRSQVINHEGRITYLELYGGGINPPPPDTDSEVLVFEDGTQMTFEDGSKLVFEDSVNPIPKNAMILEDNSLMIFEDGSVMVFEDNVNPTPKNAMVFEDNSLMVFEDNKIMTFEN